MKSLRKVIEQVQSFCKDKEKIYVYGAGKYGENCKKILDYLNVNVQAYIVTNLSKKDVEERRKDNIPIIQWGEDIIPENSGIIIAMNSAYEVVPKIQKNSSILFLRMQNVHK